LIRLIVFLLFHAAIWLIQSLGVSKPDPPPLFPILSNASTVHRLGRPGTQGSSDPPPLFPIYRMLALSINWKGQELRGHALAPSSTYPIHHHITILTRKYLPKAPFLNNSAPTTLQALLGLLPWSPNRSMFRYSVSSPIPFSHDS